MAERVRICEMGPRDGLQNEAALVSAADKVKLVGLLSRTGLDYVEAGSFVSPKWVPRMAGSGEVLKMIERRPGVTYAALTPNERGLDDAIAAGADEVAVFAAASETFSMKNINCSIAESLARYAALIHRAPVPVRGYVSCAVACPYEGAVAPRAVADVAHALLEMGCREISLGDTIGAGDAAACRAMLDAVLGKIPAPRLAGHFHDTRGRALEMIGASLDMGLRVFDASVAGAGGCPFAPGAKGNVDTRAAVSFIEALGYATGVDLAALSLAEEHMRALIGRPP